MAKPKVKGFFVTGTGTDVGKTWVSSLLAKGFSKKVPVSYMKPVQTGCTKSKDGSLVAPDFEFVKKHCKIVTGDPALHAPYCFEPACSPHLAARLDNQEIDFAAIAACAGDICAMPAMKNGLLVVEGAGGVLVPFDAEKNMLQLMMYLNLPIILVTTPDLGTINHTLLTLCALRSVHVKLAGVVMNNCHNVKNDFIYKDNRDTLKAILLGIPFCEVKHGSRFTPEISEFCNELLSVKVR